MSRIVVIEVVGDPLPERTTIFQVPLSGGRHFPKISRTANVRKWIADVRLQAIAQKPSVPYQGAVRYSYEFRLPRPQYLMTKKFHYHCTRRGCNWQSIEPKPACPNCGSQTSYPEHSPHHTIAPDLGNLEKPLQDALEGVLFVNDKQLVEVGVEGHRHQKRYAEIGEYPGVTVAIEYLEEEK